MASDGKVVELLDGARIRVKCTVNEDLVKGRKLNDAKCMRNGKSIIKTKTEGDTKVTERWVERIMYYPFPEGLVMDPFTKKPARTDMSPTELGKAIAVWQTQMDALVAAGGKFVMTLPPDKNHAEAYQVSTTTALTVPDKDGRPVSVLPTIHGEGGIFGKGFKLGIQADINSSMAKEYIVKVAGSGPTRSASAASFDPDASY